MAKRDKVVKIFTNIHLGVDKVMVEPEAAATAAMEMTGTLTLLAPSLLL